MKPSCVYCTFSLLKKVFFLLTLSRSTPNSTVVRPTLLALTPPVSPFHMMERLWLHEEVRPFCRRPCYSIVLKQRLLFYLRPHITWGLQCLTLDTIDALSQTCCLVIWNQSDLIRCWVLLFSRVHWFIYACTVGLLACITDLPFSLLSTAGVESTH